MARTDSVASMQRYFSIATLFCVSLAGCGRNSGEAPALTSQPRDLPGVYVSSMACSNCKVIAATLWVRDDGRFFLRQRYVGDDGAAVETSYGFGRWSWDQAAADLVLRGHGPERHFKKLDGERLEFTSAPAKDVFTRDPRSPAFTDRARFEGESVMTDRGATFTQCVTGLEMPIVSNEPLNELRRLHRSLNPAHKVARTAVDAHIIAVAVGAATKEQLVIDKVIEIKPGTGC